MKARIIERTAPSGAVEYVIQQRHFLFRWWWCDACINKVLGAYCRDSWSTLAEAQANLHLFDGTPCREVVIQEIKGESA